MAELLTVAEVAATLRITTQTVRALVNRGELPGVRVGHQYRIPKAALAQIVNVDTAPLQQETEVERNVLLRPEDACLVEEASREVFGWIDDLKAKYPSVEPGEVAQVYGQQLSANETGIDRSCVEDVFIGVALGVYAPESLE